MPDENPTLGAAESENMADGALLTMLVETYRPWSVDEIAREADPALGFHPDDSLGRLYAAGLIHRLDGFV